MTNGAPNWVLHFRNFNAGDNWFGVYHAGCSGLGLAWRDLRPNCWGAYVPQNPLGGPYSDGNSLSVYQPANFVVNFEAWLAVILEGLETALNFAIYVGSGGESAQALANTIADAFQTSADAVQAALDANNVSAAQLQQSLSENFNVACQAINTTPAWVTSCAISMGLTSWGLISGSDYVSRIHTDNPSTNGNFGFSVFRAPPYTTSAPNYIANHAFINCGQLVYFWDQYTLAEWGGNMQFWLPWS